MLAFGYQEIYQWLVTDNRQLDLLQVCPEIVLGKYVAITSIHSSALVPNDEEETAGWQSRGGIAYSPKVRMIDTLPREGWDEWYIFTNYTDLGSTILKKIPLTCRTSQDMFASL